jgi:hypothetical protein
METIIEETRKLESKIAAEKHARKLQIAARIATIIGIVILIWIMVSFIEVQRHNDVYFSTGEVIEYSALNFFKILEKLF